MLVDISCTAASARPISVLLGLTGVSSVLLPPVIIVKKELKADISPLPASPIAPIERRLLYRASAICSSVAPSSLIAAASASKPFFTL